MQLIASFAILSSCVVLNTLSSASAFQKRSKQEPQTQQPQRQQLSPNEVEDSVDNGGGNSNNGLNAVESQAMLNSVNAYRSQNGLARLRIDQRLSAASVAHAQDQAHRCYMTHDSVDGSKAWDRMNAQGYVTSTAAENVAAGQPTVESVMKSWWNSPGHRANILSDKVKDIGFAKAVNNACGNYQVYWTQDFGSAE
ncbi:hypothetical protein PybrP1_009691 [[Pythium] brassicae (nom. inval.)]|nr:hypothetical protein PybrP1_009691 [[Pythium] brassicae (nom. inval.)]